jgi:hypothetical protein
MPRGEWSSPRDAVRKVFLGMFGFVLVAVFLLIVTALVRLAFVFILGVFLLGIPAIGQIVRADPWVILALVIAALLAWSRPWEDHASDGEVPRRGSHVQRRGSQSLDDE